MNASDGQPDNAPLENILFDRKARQLHVAALAHVSAATQAQLHQRRRAARAGNRDAAAHRMVRPLVWTGALALLAIAIVLPLAMQLPDAPANAPSAIASSTVATTAPSRTLNASDSDDNSLATLEEDPRLYVWLASSDAIALASE